MSFFFLKNVMLNVTLKPELLLKQFNLLIMSLRCFVHDCTSTTRGHSLSEMTGCASAMSKVGAF